MENVQSHATSNPSSISQYAAEAGLNGPQEFVDEMVAAFKERGEFVYKALNAIPGVKCLKPEGAFYVFPDCREAIARLHADGKLKAPTDAALTEYLMEQDKAVAVVPGSAFGMEGYVRISYATSMDNLKKAAERMSKALSPAKVPA